LRQRQSVPAKDIDERRLFAREMNGLAELTAK